MKIKGCFPDFNGSPERSAAIRIYIALIIGFGIPLWFSGVHAQDSELIEAIKRDDFKAVKAFLQAGADPNMMDRKTGLSTLHLSAEKGSIESVRTLLSYGASEGIRSDDGSTPLLLATRLGHVGVVQLLRCSGADPKAQNTEGQTPLSVAAAAKRDDLEAVLKEPECVSLALLEALQNKTNEDVKNLFKKLKKAYGVDKYPVYTGTLLQEAFLRMSKSARHDLLPLLIDALSVPNLRFEASLALHRFPGRIAMPALISALGKSKADMRLRLVEVIAAIDLDNAKPYLRRLLNDSEHPVRAYAKDLLRRLGEVKAVEVQRNEPETPLNIKPQLVLQRGHLGTIQSVAFTPDGRYVLTSSDDRTAVLWEVASGQEIRRFEGHSFSVETVDISPDGNYVATGSENGVVLSGLQTGRVIRTLPSLKAKSVAFSSDSKHLAVAGMVDHTEGVQIWNIETGNRVRAFVMESIPSTVAFSPTEQHILGVDSHRVAIWDVASGLMLKHFVASEESFDAAFFCQSGLYVLTLGGRTARIWDVKSGKEVRRFYRDSYEIPKKFLAESCDKLPLKSLTVHERVKLIRLLAGTYKGFSSAALSPHSDFLVTGGWDATAQVWDVGTGQLFRDLRGHEMYVSAVAFLPTGKYVLTGGADMTTRLWELERATEVQRLEPAISSITAVAYSAADALFLVGNYDGMVQAWNLKTGSQVARLRAHDQPVEKVVIAPDTLTTASCDNTVRLWDRRSLGEKGRFDGAEYKASVLSLAETGKRFVTSEWNGIVAIRGFPGEGETVHVTGRGSHAGGAALSIDGGRLLTWKSRSAESKGPEAMVWDLTGEKTPRKLQGLYDGIRFGTFSPRDKIIMTGMSGGEVVLWNAETGDPTLALSGHKPWWVEAGVFSATNPGLIVTGGFDATARLWNTQTGAEPREFVGHSSGVSSLALIADDRFLATGSYDGTVRIWNLASGEELLRLISFRNGTWVVVTPDGRFETSNLEEIKGLHWVMPDDPMRSLSPEIFMRDYYEPRLLPRVLGGEQFKPIRPLAELNRVQPGIKILKIEKGATPDIAEVTVEVSAAEGTFQRGGKDVVMKTGVHDLRLYRNGQLVGQWPEAGELTYKSLNTTSAEELRAWRKATEIPLDERGKATKTFSVRLPRREDLKEVAFSVYAFNLDRVKSETARQTYKVREKLKSVKGRAYVITVGVSGNEDMAWRLSFASEDAKLIQRTLVKRLEDSKRYEKVVPVCLITTPPGSGDLEAQAECRGLMWPTKENIKTVLDILAGREVERARMEQLPGKLRSELRRVEPEDLVLLSFSSHGVTDKGGEFYLLPYDLGMESAGEVIPELLKRSISSQELSLWLSTVDAEQLVMVVDACHSAAAVEAEGFKPGPMGNPGLGQLSYDKGMPILVATQATDSAWAGGYSLLTLALAKEGIEEKQMGLSDALKYAEGRVPKLYEETMGKEEKKKIQEPKLFEFKR